MSSDLDLRLPRQVARLRTPSGDKKFAIYSMAGLDQRELRNLRHDINSAEFVNEACELSPRASFAGMSLGAVLDYHLTLRVRDSRFHPLLFIVATHRNWQDYGVILVHLDFDEQGSVGHARCAIDQAASYCMNMDIGNMSWDDVKDEEMFEWPAYFRMPKSVPTTGLTPRKQFGIYCFHSERMFHCPLLFLDEADYDSLGRSTSFGPNLEGKGSITIAVFSGNNIDCTP